MALQAKKRVIIDRLCMERNSGVVSYLGGGVEDRKRVESKISFLLVEPNPMGLGSKGYSLGNPACRKFFFNVILFVFFPRFALIDIYSSFFVRLTLTFIRISS